MANPIHIFKSGTHQPMEGEPINFSQADLEASAAAYDPTLHEAPICIGHPKDDLPAHGWIKQLIVTPEGLFGAPHQMEASFSEAVRKKHFKKVSASFYEPNSPINPVPGVFYLRHVAFLGAMAPAIKGLKPIEFSDNQTGVVFFSESEKEESSMSKEQGFIARLMEFLKKNLGEDEAEKIITSDGITAIEEAIKESPTQATMPLDKNAGADEILPEVVIQLGAISQENLRLAAENEELQAQIADRGSEAESAEFSEVIRRKVKPSHRAAVRSILTMLSKPQGSKNIEFSENGLSKPLAPAFRAYLSSLPDVVDFSELATKHKAAKPTTINPLLADAERRANRK